MKEMAKRAKDKKMEKAFIDQKVDSLRLPYGKMRVDIPRKTSFIATTNRLDILNDSTGSRRWWPVMCGYDWDDVGNMIPWPKTRKIDVEGLREIRDQLWLEALHYAKDETQIHYLTDDEESNREEGREAFISLHPYTPLVKTIVENLHSDNINHFQLEDIIGRMEIPVAQRTFALKNTIQDILGELGYSKNKVRVPQPDNKTKPLWRWCRG